MIRCRVAPDMVLIGGVALLLIKGILSPCEALAGLSNEGMATVGVLFIVGAGVRQTGGVDWIAQYPFGRPKTATRAVAQLMLRAGGLSAFMNNMPLVAMHADFSASSGRWTSSVRSAASP